MKIIKRLSIVVCLVAIFVFSVNVNALLTDNLDGTVTQIRNDGTVLMWLKDANTAETNTFGVSGISSTGAMIWSTTANSWIANMNAANYLGYNDWRLPKTVDGPWVWGYDGTTIAGCNITTSEMGYMYYIELDNKGYCDASGNCPQSGWKGDGKTNAGPFANIEFYYYWSGTATTTGTPWPWDVAWVFDFNGGSQGSLGDDNVARAWAVRTVSVVPDPIGSLETHQIKSTSVNGVWTSALKAGQLYVFEVSGTWISSVYNFTNNGVGMCDAEWMDDPYGPYSPSDPWVEVFVPPFSYSRDMCDLLIGGVSIDWLGSYDGINWEPHVFSLNHIYRYYYTGTGNPVHLYISDQTPYGPAMYGDNAGSLLLKVELASEIIYYYCDDDGDGYISSSISGTCLDNSCVPSECQIISGNDCNDTNDTVNPAMTETPYNCKDDDCNASTFDDDLDADGFLLADDCNDNDANINPNSAEICDGQDNNCNGKLDETDGDDDGVSDCIDNCPLISNSDQSDVDGDGQGDACDSCDNRPITGFISPSTDTLWPPNHEMVFVTINGYSLITHNPDTHISTSSVGISEYSKKSSGETTGTNIYDKNNFEPDYEITGDITLKLRSERAGASQGRTYTVTVTATDCSGSYNFTTQVEVPHDKGG